MDDCYISPTIVLNPLPDSPLMQEEVFGPVLSVIPVDSLEDAIAFAATKPTPLSLYVYTTCPPRAPLTRRPAVSPPTHAVCLAS